MRPIRRVEFVGPAIVLAAALAAASPGPASRADEPVAREVGCFPDNRDADPIGTRGRDLDGAAYKDPSMTLNKCLSFCSDQGFKFAGLQYGSWCFCGNSYGRYTVGGASCTTRCGGDPAQFCGGEWANNVWEILESKAAVPPPPMAPATALQRFDQPKLGGIRLDSRPSGSSGFDVPGVAHSFCQRMGYAGMLEYRVADAGQTIAIDDGTLFANDRNSNTTYRFIVCGP